MASKKRVKKKVKKRPVDRDGWERSKNNKVVRGIDWPLEKIHSINRRFWDEGETETTIFKSGTNPASFYKYVTTTRAEWEKMKAAKGV